MTNCAKTRLEDFAELRIKEMDEAGIDVHVLSLTTPGVQSLAPAQAVKIANSNWQRLTAQIKRENSGGAATS